MMMLQRWYISSRIFLMCMLVSFGLGHAYVKDNRFIPLFDRPLLWIDHTHSFFEMEAFAATADSAYGTDEKVVGIPEIFGLFDQKKLDDARALLSKEKLVPVEYRGQSLPWELDGCLHAQGIQFKWHQRVTSHFSFGASWMFMRVEADHTYLLLKSGLESGIARDTVRRSNMLFNEGDEEVLDDVRRQMYKDIGITKNHAEQRGFGDIDAYVRIGGDWEYELKCKMLHAGLQLGTLIPTGEKRELFSPASIPFGGNGHWGIYGEIDFDAEIREDWKVGFSFRVSRRLSRTQRARYPLAGEPELFGAIVDNMGIKPGVTINFSPYIAFENIRKGLGLAVQYMMTSHQPDRLTDKRSDKTIPVDLCPLQDNSKWGSSYFSFQAFYDFDKMEPQRGLGPVLYIRWDLPYKLFVTSRSLETHKIGIGIDFTY